MLRTLVVALTLICALLVGALPADATMRPAQEDVTTTVPVSDEDSPVGDIIPRPNSGQAPDSANDPGGWQQYLVFGLLLAGLGAIVLLVRRESRRARAARSG